jgi:hypothetical protein
MYLEQNREEFNSLASERSGHKRTLNNYLSIIDKAIQCADYKSYKNILRGNGKEDRQLFRKLHDYYGWMAKNANCKRGGCAGTLYRSSEYMKLLREKRIGDKVGQNVHIEHVIPNHYIPRLIWGQKQFLNDLESVFDFFLKISVCAAVDQENERGLIDKRRDINGSRINCREEHPGIKLDGDSAYLTNDQPFSRYIGSGVHIYTMSTGKEISFEEFTYEDHFKALKEHKAFHWNTYNP